MTTTTKTIWVVWGDTMTGREFLGYGPTRKVAELACDAIVSRYGAFHPSGFIITYGISKTTLGELQAIGVDTTPSQAKPS